MAGKRFIDLVTNAETISQFTGDRPYVKSLANDVVATICGMHEWPFLWTTDWFQTTAEYAESTVTVTDSSATVTGDSTTFTEAMVGRKFRAGNDSAYYTIKAYVSATELTLDQEYQGTTTAGASYSIYKDEYLLGAQVDAQKRIRQAENGIAIFSLSATEFDDWYPSQQGTGIPGLDVFSGRAVKTYSTGTVALPASFRTLTGVGTLWTTAEGVGRGTKLKIGTSLFTVKTVDSATQITLYEANGTTAVSAGTAYTALLENYVVQLHAAPVEELTFYYRFQRIPAVMDADNDLPDLPYSMHPLVVLGMLPSLYRLKGHMDRVVEAEQTFDKRLAQWMQKYSLPVQDRRTPIHPFSMSTRLAEARWPNGTGIPLSR